jgi:type 1 glutamine amidotransferase
MTPFTSRLRLLLLSFAAVLSLPAADKNVLLIAGPPSHGPGQHEHNAGVQLLQKCLAGVPGLKTAVALNGFPQNLAALDTADAILIYADGGPKHVALQEENLAALRRAMDRGAGLALVHYAVEPTIEKGEKEFLAWVGGAFEINWSVNPIWNAAFTTLPVHPVTRGVRPFTLRDEWYFNMRFVEGLKGVTPILSAAPTPDTMSRKDGPHEGNPAVRAKVAQGEPAVVAWAFERANGGRGFGFTGAHFHQNWGNDDFRRLVLNAILWTAKMEVPAGGVASRVTAEDLAANLDPKGGAAKKKSTP